MYSGASIWCSLLLLVTVVNCVLSSWKIDIVDDTTLARCRTVLDAWCADESRYCLHGATGSSCSTLHASLSSEGWVCQTIDAFCSCPAHEQLTRLLHLCANNLDNLTAVDVFVSGESGTNTYRIPAIVQTNRGTLLAFAEGRVSDGSDCHRKLIVMKRSENSGITWGKLQVRQLHVGTSVKENVPFVYICK